MCQKDSGLAELFEVLLLSETDQPHELILLIVIAFGLFMALLFPNLLAVELFFPILEKLVTFLYLTFKIIHKLFQVIIIINV